MVTIWNNLGSQNGIFNLNTQGDIKTQGMLLLGGMTSGQNVWSLNPSAESWVMKYGKNFNEYNRFFGVALPRGSSTSFGNGIRFNYNSNGIVINPIGIRTYERDSNNWKSNFTLQYIKNTKLGIKCSNNDKRLDLYTNGNKVYLVNNYYDISTGCYLVFNRDTIALKRYNTKGESENVIVLNAKTKEITMCDTSNKSYSIQLT